MASGRQNLSDKGRDNLTLRERWFGDKAFYRMVIAIALPILVQNAITNFVSLLDNVMVGRLGTDPMSGVAIANQLLFVFNLTVFGGVSGAGIFGAQYFGRKDYAGVRYTFRFKLICGGVILAAALALLMCMDTQLISMFLHEGSQTGDIGATLEYARAYLHIMFWGMLPFAVSQAYASTLRESGQAVVPMNASIIAVVVNLVFNYLLIYGKFGFPQMGVRGAALATVIARYVEAGAVVLWTHRHGEFCPYVYDLFKGFRIPMALVKKIILRGMPLLINEMLWSTGMTILAQSYSTRGLAAVAAYNISSTVMNLFNVAVMAVGNAVGIIVGNLLGAGKMQEARRTDTRLIVFSVLSCMVVCFVMAMASPFIPLIYNTTDEVRLLARDLILITAVFMPLHAFLHASYFTMRSGGKTMLTFLFDSGSIWILSIPVALVLSRFTTLPIRPLFTIVQAVDLLKATAGYLFVRNDFWLNNIVEDIL